MLTGFYVQIPLMLRCACGCCKDLQLEYAVKCLTRGSGYAEPLGSRFPCKLTCTPTSSHGQHSKEAGLWCEK